MSKSKISNSSDQDQAIPLEWIGNYVDQLLEVAAKFSPHSPMQAAALLRADHTMDLVKAWKESKERERK
jgi:hypothetical protein